MTEIKIKEQNLYVVIKDLMDEALAIDRPNKTKICNFIVNLVENGGHITNAAMEAGYGPKKTKDGRKLTTEETRKIAGNEGSRLLENAGISRLYERFLSHRFMADMFTKSFNRAHSISILYQIAMNTCVENPRQATIALKEASTLAGHYEISDKDKAIFNLDEQNEAAAAKPLLEAILEKMNRKTAEVPKPVNVSEVYN